MEIFWFFCFSVIEIVAARHNNLKPKMSCPGAGYVVEGNKCIKRTSSLPQIRCGMKKNATEYDNLKNVMKPYSLKSGNMLNMHSSAANSMPKTDHLRKKHMLNGCHKKANFSTALSNMGISLQDMPQILSSLKYMSKMGVTIHDLFKMGFSINEMLKIASSPDDMSEIVSLFDQISKIGISPNDMLNVASSPNDMLNEVSLPNDILEQFLPKVEPAESFLKNNQCVTKEIVNPTEICKEGRNLVGSLCETVANPEVTCPADFIPVTSDGKIVECFTLFEEVQPQGFSESGNRSSPKEIIKPVVRCMDGFTFHDSECVKLSLPQQSCPVDFTLEGDQCSQESVSSPVLECYNESVLKDNKCIFTEEAMPLFSCSRPYKLKNRRCCLF